MSKKWFGYTPTPTLQYKKVEKLLLPSQGTLDFCDIGITKGKGAGKLSLPFKSVVRFVHDAFEDDAQKTGDCTTHATRNAFDISRATEIIIGGEYEDWAARGATEAIYKYRGHNGQGMNPGLAIEFLIKYGGLLRRRYVFADLRQYNPEWAMRAGVNEVIKKEAALHPAKFFLRLRTVEEARDALACGFGVICGSNYGNDGTRDKHGIATWNDSWNHCMAWGGADETGDDLFFLILQSWGIWNKGGMPDWGPIPGGSFLVPSRDAKKMIAQGETWAVGNVQGWPLQDLPDWGVGAFL